jgi:hypothetical protein
VLLKTQKGCDEGAPKKARGERKKMKKKILLGLFSLLLLSYASATPDVNVVSPNGGEYLWGRIDIDFNVIEPWNQPVLDASIYYSSTPGSQENLINTIDLLNENYCTPDYNQEEMWQYMNSDVPSDMPESGFFPLSEWIDDTYDGNLMYFGKYMYNKVGSLCYWSNYSGYLNEETGDLVQTDELNSIFSQVHPTGNECWTNLSTGGGDSYTNEYSDLHIFHKPSSSVPSIGESHRYQHYHNPPPSITGSYDIMEYDWDGSVFQRNTDDELFDWFNWSYTRNYGLTGGSHWDYTFSGNICQDGNCVKVTFRKPFTYDGNFWLVGRWDMSPSSYRLYSGDPDPTTTGWYGYSYSINGNWQRNDFFVEDDTDLNSLTWGWQGTKKCQFYIWEEELYCIGQDGSNEPVSVKWNNSTQKWVTGTDLNKGIVDQVYHSSSRSGFGAFFVPYQDDLWHIQLMGGSNGNTATWKNGDLVWNTEDKRTCSYSWHTGDHNGNWYIDINVTNERQTTDDASDGNFEIDNNDFIEIVSPVNDSDFYPSQSMDVWVKMKDFLSSYVDFSELEYRLDSTFDWNKADKSANNFPIISFVATAPTDEGNYELSVRADINGEKVMDSINYTVNKGDLYIEWVKPIQVVEDVNMVAGKATVVRVKVVNTGPPATVRTKLTYNGEDETRIRIDGYEILDFYPTPYSTEGFQQAIAEVDYDGQISETDESNNTKTVDVNVVEVLDWYFVFVPAYYFESVNPSFSPSLYKEEVRKSREFLLASYPISDEKLHVEVQEEQFTTNLIPIGSEPKASHFGTLLAELRKYRLKRYSQYDRIIGVLNPDWRVGRSTHQGAGEAAKDEIVYTPEQFKHYLVDHELGHTYSLCDEYNYLLGTGQDLKLLLGGKGGCANSFPDYCFNFNQLTNCQGNKDISGFWVDKREERKTIEEEGIFYYNIMGKSSTEEAWLDNTTYLHLLTEFQTPHTDLNEVVIVSGLIDKSGGLSFYPFHLTESIITEISDGNYVLELQDVNGQIINDYNFGPAFIFSPASDEDSNAVPFLFTIPYDSNTYKIVGKYFNEVKEERVITPNAPTIDINSPIGGEIWSGTQTIEWTANDIDGDQNLTYTIEYSDDNGGTWHQIISDYNKSSYDWNVGNVAPGNTYRIGVTVSDSVRIADDNSGAFTIQEPDLNVVPSFWEFGEVARGSILIQDFNMINSGNQDLNLQDINSSLDINISGISLPLTLQPNESQIFTATIDTLTLSDEYLGDININSNDPNENPKTIFVEGTILNLAPSIVIDINAPYAVVYPNSFLLDANILTETAPLRDANITLSLPEGLSTIDSLTVDLGNIFVSDTKDANWTIDVNESGLFEIILTVSSINAEDFNESKYVSVRFIEITGVSTDKNSYALNETVTIDTNIANHNPDVTYTGFDLNIVITDPQDNNTTLQSDINVLYADSNQTVATVWDENKTSGQHTITSYLYDYNGQLIDTATTIFAVVTPSTNWILGYGGNKLTGTDHNITYSILDQPAKKLIGTDYNVIMGWSYYYDN